MPAASELSPHHRSQEHTSTPEKEKSQYKFLVFDFHGTMTEHQLRLVKSLHAAGHQALGHHFGKELYQTALCRAPKRNEATGESAKAFIERILQERGYPEDRIAGYFERYKQLMQETYIPVPGIIATMKRLQQDGAHIALLTNGSHRQSIIDTLRAWDLEDLSTSVYSSHNTGARKPNIQTMQCIVRDWKARNLQVDPRQTLVVGDLMDDILTAKNFGADSVLMVRGAGRGTLTLRDPRPTYVITHPTDLIDIVKGNRPAEVRKDIPIPMTLWTKEEWGPKD